MNGDNGTVAATDWNAVQYLKFERERTQPSRDLAARIELPSPSRILDIGCGSGYPIDVFLSGRGFTVTGIDPSKEMIGLANRLELDGASFQACGLFEFEPDAPFDAVIAFDSLFHIDLDSQPAIYPKVASWLKPGGLFLFTHGKKTGTVSGKMFGESFLYGALDAVLIAGDLTAGVWVKSDWNPSGFMRIMKPPSRGREIFLSSPGKRRKMILTGGNTQMPTPFHWTPETEPDVPLGRSTAVNLIEGSLTEVIRFLDELSSVVHDRAEWREALSRSNGYSAGKTGLEKDKEEVP